MSSVHDTLFMRAARREPTERTPVWFMRQAGRVLAEYRAVREKLSLLEICRRPELCAEVTLQPVRRFEMDAAILFADIMHPLVGVGVDLDIVEGTGPVIERPVRSSAEVQALRPLDPEADLPYVLEAIRVLVRELGGRTPVIGFAGAPFTLASYLVEGRPSRDFLKTKSLMYGQPALWHDLMERLSGMVAALLRAKIAAGASAVQLFDSWVGCLSPKDYVEYVRPHVRSIFARVADLGAPMIHFGVNTATLLPHMKDDGGTVLGLDWRTPLDEGWEVIGHHRGVQGNLDPAVLLAPREIIEREVADVLRRAAGRPGHIFNLGHGLHPGTPVEGVAAAVEAVKRLSAEGRGREDES
ncbi:MAG: uroporphyrinogen decarboxylase [Gemmatimonadaceae bacterium]